MLRTPPPPYSLSPASFRFPALAAQAAKLPLGAGRETILSTLLAARLAADSLSGVPLDASTRAARAEAARDWFRASCPDARVRVACTAVADATAGGSSSASSVPDSDDVAKAVGRLVELAARHLDRASRAELEALAEGRDVAP